jgi:hypothetical protein
MAACVCTVRSRDVDPNRTYAGEETNQRREIPPRVSIINTGMNLMTFAEYSDQERPAANNVMDIVESALISPGVAKAAALAILIKMRTLRHQIQNPDTEALSALSSQLVLLGSMLALAIGTMSSDSDAAKRFSR